MLRVDRSGHATVLQLQVAERDTSLQGSHLLASVGRAPTTDTLNLAAGGVATDARGFIRVNDRLETNIPGIWALGNINGGPQYTHVSLDDYRIVKVNLIDGGDCSTRDSVPEGGALHECAAAFALGRSADRLVPSCLFIDPELAHVGLTETEAQQQGYAIRVAKLDASAIPRAKTLGQTDGLMKAIIDTETGRILGCSLLCHEAGEVISTVQMLDNWDCQGVYIPNDVTAIALTPDGQNQELTGGVVIKVPKGTNLVLTTNQGTGAVEFNIPVTPVAKAEKVNWYVPKVSQASIDTRPTSAPTNQS